MRNFTIGQKVSDEEVLSPSGLDRIIELIRVMHPFVSLASEIEFVTVLTGNITGHLPQ